MHHLRADLHGNERDDLLPPERHAAWRVAEDEILDALAQLAEGSRISSISRTTGHKEDTILDWLREAAKQTEAVEGILMADHRISRGQLDGLWAYVGNKGEKNSSGILRIQTSEGIMGGSQANH